MDGCYEHIISVENNGDKGAWGKVDGPSEDICGGADKRLDMFRCIAARLDAERFRHAQTCFNFARRVYTCVGKKKERREGRCCLKL